MNKIFFTFVCFLSINNHAHHQVFLESKYSEQVGDALVSVTHDRFYDTYHWGLTCFDKSSTVFPPMGLLITCAEVADFGVSFLLSEEPKESTEELKLQYRFDEGYSTIVEFKFSALNRRHVIVEYEPKDFATFLENLSSATEITFSVGDVEDTLQLIEMNKAVEKFREILAESYIIELEPSEIEDEKQESNGETVSEDQTTTED